MANSGGTNGTVTITTTSGGSLVTVSYPAQIGPPAQDAHTDTFNPCADPWLRSFEHAMPPLKVDVVAAGAPANPPTSVTAHA